MALTPFIPYIMAGSNLQTGASQFKVRIKPYQYLALVKTGNQPPYYVQLIDIKSRAITWSKYRNSNQRSNSKTGLNKITPTNFLRASC